MLLNKIKMEPITKYKTGIGALSIMALILAAGLIGQISDGNVYYCADREIVMVCDKLSKVNDDGLQTRCYFEEEERTRYKNCGGGWDIVVNEAPINQLDNEDYVCGENKLITECENSNGELLLRVGG